MIHGNEENFDSLINKDLVLVDFFATWCGPCKMLTPVLDDLASDRDELSIVKIDVDECNNLAKRYGVMSVPTLVLFKNGVEVAKSTGYMPKEMLNSFIEENR